MDNHEETPLEVMAPSAILAMEKAQIDIQISTAKQYPRSIELFKKRALSMACLDPATAESCIYVRPVGKENGKQVFAEGPSIRLAEIVAVSYGNLRAASKVVEQTERYVKCVGMAHDLESNTAMSADCIESTVTKDGRPYSERQRALVAKVCGAKALRDAIFKCVPRALCKPIMEAAMKVAAGQDKSLDERRKKAQAWTGSLKIDDARVLAALGVSGWADVTNDHLNILTGLKTAMADGDETIDSAFPPLTGQGEPAKNAPAATDHQKATATTTTTAPAKPAAAPATTATQPTQPAKPAEKPKEAPKEPAKATEAPAKPAQETPKPEKAPETPAKTETQQEAAAKEQIYAQQPTTPEQIAAQEEAAEAAAGLAPAPAQEAQQQVQGEFKDAALEPQEGDTDNVLSIKMQLKQAGVTFSVFRDYLRKKKLMKTDQTDLREVTNARADAINRSMGQWFDDIRKFAQSGESTLS